MRHMYHAFYWGALLFAQSLAGRSKEGVLTLSIVDVWGKPVSDCGVKSLKDANGHKRAYVFRDGTAVLPYGDYLVRIECEAFLPVDKRVSVRQPRPFHIVGVKFAGVEMTPPSGGLRGRVSEPVDSSSWCKATGLYTGDEYFSTVSFDGTFGFPDLPVGVYSLVCRVFGGSFLSRTARVTAGDSASIQVGLGPN